MTHADHRKEWTKFAEQREAEHKKKRPKKEPSPEEKAAAEKALDDLTTNEPKAGDQL
jgi:hypothetical protein